MFWYPFDIQECTMEFNLKEVTAMFVELVPGDQFKNKNKPKKHREEFVTESLKYTGETMLDEYYIDNIALFDGESVMTVKITFGRGLFTIILTIYLSTILVNVIGHSAVFYKDSFFEAQVSLNVTVMLVQVTMFTSVSTKNVLSEINLPFLTSDHALYSFRCLTAFPKHPTPR